jgi:hypothetical protein
VTSPNRDALVRVARLLGPLTSELVFVGGRVAELLVSEPGSTRVRPTDDSDAVCEVASRTEYHRLGELAWEIDVVPGVVVRIASAPVFLATKWDVFNDRAAGDWRGSHDIEDIITIVAGRPELLAELQAGESDVRDYVANQTGVLLEAGIVGDVVAGALPDARLIPNLVTRVIERLEAIGQLRAKD